MCICVYNEIADFLMYSLFMLTLHYCLLSLSLSLFILLSLLPLSLQTQLDDVPISMIPFQGRLLVGVGKLLRIYDIGKKKMLRKCENKVQICISASGVTVILINVL